ncbi:hypothetical protein OGAPHI_002476 [Ogataea philodendri]|uniref:Sulfite efflux pump SSU1 n=1 Tax=Ogataea philodendri TaxID=1378263 RepID=A0A9P8PBC2_9ASCO|nr:uncharacterized protein OGAPHI_002476 [Ogataea philodendri]KAH3668722.1 hypothetical protein OGAPHI_002476 [Ogataea philodendri]
MPVSELKPSSSFDSFKRSRFACFVDTLLVDFHPMYFVITMGTGITSAVMYRFPIESVRVGMKYVGIVYFFIDLIAFFVVHVLFVLRYFVLPNRYDGTSFAGLLKDHRLNVFLGAQVMGFGSLINMIYYLKPEWTIFVYSLWWIQVGLTLLCAWGLTYVMFALNEIPASDLNATILLPAVTLTVAASTGCIVSQQLSSYRWKLSSEIVTFMLFGNAIMLALPLIAVYFYKLFTSGLPPKQSVYSCFIPIGVLGQGSFALLLNFQSLAQLVQADSSLVALTNGLDSQVLLTIATALQLCSVYVALLLISMGVCISVVAALCVLQYGWIHSWSKALWASTFPLGTMAVSQALVYELTGWIGFKITASVYSFALIAVTTYCLINTCIHEIAWHKMAQSV